MVVLRGGAVSYEPGTPVQGYLTGNLKTLGVRFLIVKKLSENARCPFLNYARKSLNFARKSQKM